MDKKQMPDTPWHIGFVKKDESDPRRHKARCFYYQRGECHCTKSAYYTSRCPGSSHCSKYIEDEVLTQDIRELQAEKKRAEQYHTKMIRKRIELEQKLGENELYAKYGKVLECPVCGGRLIRDRCNYCGFIRPEPPIVKKNVVPKRPREPVIQKTKVTFDKDVQPLRSEPSKDGSVKPLNTTSVTKKDIAPKDSGTLIRYTESGANCPVCKALNSSMTNKDVYDKEGHIQIVSIVVCQKCGCIYLTRKLLKKLQMKAMDENLNIVM